MTHCRLAYWCDTGLYLYLLPFQFVSSPGMDWVRRGCYFGEENAVLTISVNGLASHMLALLLGHVHDSYQAVCRAGVVTELRSIQWVVGLLTCVSLLGHCRTRHWGVCLRMPDVCEIWGEKTTTAKGNQWANSVESNQRQAECVALHASCLAMLMPKVSHLFLLKKKPESFQLDPLREYFLYLYLPNCYCSQA